MKWSSRDVVVSLKGMIGLEIGDLIGLTVTVELNWGLSLNYYHSSRGGQSLQIIPPTTLMGALAYPLARMMGWPETTRGYSTASQLRGMIRGVYYSVVKGVLIPYADIGKIWFYKVREKTAVSDAAGIQKLYSQPGTTISIIYAISRRGADRLLGGAWRNLVTSAAYSMTRIGGKESIVAVTSVDSCSIAWGKGDETRYTIPLYNVDNVQGQYVAGEVVDWRITGVGRYFDAPTVRIAQPQDAFGRSVSVKVAPKRGLLDVCGELVVPW